MFADMVNLRPAPIVGAKRVRPLGVSESKEELEYQLDEKRAQYDSALASRAQALAAYKDSVRKAKQLGNQINQLKKKLAKSGDEND